MYWTNKKTKCIGSLSLLFVLSVVIKSCLLSDPKVRFENSINKSVKLEDQGRYEEALKEINKAIKLDSTKSTAFVIRGRITRELQRYSFAMQDFSKAIFLNSKNTSAYYNKAVTFYTINNDDSALKYFEAAIETKKSGDFYVEIENKNQLIQNQVDIPLEEIRFWRGVSLYSKKIDSLALNDFYYSLMHGYNKAKSQLYIGVLLIDKGNKVEGCNYLKQAELNGEKGAEKYLKEYCDS